MTQTIRLFFAGILCAVLFTSPVFAGPEEDAEAGFAADQKGDYATAMKLYQSAAAGGVSYAMYNLGVMYFDGKGVDRSYINAMKWYRQSAEKGYHLAQYAMGTMYEQAQGVKKDIVEAVKWYTMAADQGMMQAQQSLGVIYTTGEVGVPMDLVKAHLYFNLASKENSSAGSRRDRLKPKMTPDQLAQAEKLFKEWKPKLPAKK